MTNKCIQHKISLPFLLAGLALVLVACAPGSGGATAVPNDELPIDDLGPELGTPDPATPPPCPNNYNHPPNQVYPAEGDIVLDLQPQFEWSFDFGCQPIDFMLRIGTSTDPQSDDLFDGDTGTLATILNGVDLLPATWHRWRVYAHLTAGAYMGNGEFVSFLTGPMCKANQLVAPELIYPADDTFYTGKSWGNEYEVEADISYPSGTCLPEAFTIYISETEGFSTPNLNVFSPVIFTPNDDGFILIEDDSNDVPDCTRLYWKAWASAEGEDGPESEVHSFVTKIAGTCTLPLNWHDSPYVVAPQDTNCRASDYTASKNLETLFEGEQAEVLAVNPEGTHVLIKQPSFSVSCWVWLGLVDLMQGDSPLDPSLLRQGFHVQDPPPIPSDTPTPVPPEEEEEDTTPTPTLVPVPQCSDGIDNDGDKRIDGRDLQCKGANDNSEAN